MVTRLASPRQWTRRRKAGPVVASHLSAQLLPNSVARRRLHSSPRFAHSPRCLPCLTLRPRRRRQWSRRHGTCNCGATGSQTRCVPPRAAGLHTVWLCHAGLCDHRTRTMASLSPSSAASREPFSRDDRSASPNGAAPVRTAEPFPPRFPAASLALTRTKPWFLAAATRSLPLLLWRPRAARPPASARSPPRPRRGPASSTGV